MNRIETEKYIGNLTSEEKDKLVERMTDELWEYQKVSELNKEYLDNLPTKEIRIKEYFKLMKQHNEKRNKNQ